MMKSTLSFAVIALIGNVSAVEVENKKSADKKMEMRNFVPSSNPG